MPTLTNEPPRRLALLWIGGALVAVGTLLAVIVVTALTPLGFTSSTPAGVVGEVIILGAFIGAALMPAALGVWLLHLADRTAWPRLLSRVIALPHRLVSGAAQAPGTAASALRGVARGQWARWLLTTPLGTCLTLAPLTILPVVPADNDRGWIVAFGAMMVFSILNPITCLLRPFWWANATVSFALWMIIFVLMSATAGIARMREGVMVFMAPMMLYPAALALSGLCRLGVRRWRASAAETSVEPPTGNATR